MPFGPSTTCSISRGPGTQVATTSLPAATAAGESPQAAPPFSSDAVASRRMSWTITSCPARSSCPAIGLPMLPTPTKPSFTLQRVQLEDVVPEDLLLARVAQGQGEESVHGPGVLRVAVRVVGGGDEVVVTERFDDVLHELLVALDRAESLATEVVRGLGGEVTHLADRLPPLVVLVHAMQPEGQPAALGFQEGEAQAREALHDPAHDDVHAGEHLLHGVGGDVHDAHLLEAVGPGGPHPRARGLVEAHGDVQFLTDR